MLLGTQEFVRVLARCRNSKGVAVTTTDVLIAAIALEHGTTLFTLDKDFTRIANIIRLPLYVY